MKNHWLDKKKWLNNDVLTKAVAEYKKLTDVVRLIGPNGEQVGVLVPSVQKLTDAHDKLRGMFKILIERILEYAKFSKCEEDPYENWGCYDEYDDEVMLQGWLGDPVDEENWQVR